MGRGADTGTGRRYSPLYGRHPTHHRSKPPEDPKVARAVAAIRQVFDGFGGRAMSRTSYDQYREGFNSRAATGERLPSSASIARWLGASTWRQALEKAIPGRS